MCVRQWEQNSRKKEKERLKEEMKWKLSLKLATAGGGEQLTAIVQRQSTSKTKHDKREFSYPYAI